MAMFDSFPLYLPAVVFILLFIYWSAQFSLVKLLTAFLAVKIWHASFVAESSTL